MSDLDELPGRLTELRRLITEAHTVIADMTGLLRQLRQESATATAQMRKETEQTANLLLAELNRHLQVQQNQASADLNKAVDRARHLIVESLTMTRLRPDGKGGYRVTWARGRFDEAAALPLAPPGNRKAASAVVPPGLRRGKGEQR